MSKHELSPTDFNKPSAETRGELETLIGEVNSFIEEAPDGHVDRRTVADGVEEVHRYIVIPRMHDAEGAINFNASIIERSGEANNTLLSVTRGNTYYFYEKREGADETLKVESKTPASDTPANDLAARLMEALEQHAELKTMGVFNPSEGSVKDLAMATRDVMERITKLQS